VVTATKAADSAYSTVNATVNITVNSSLAQAIDASVKGVISAQATAATRFSETQIHNVSDHLDQLGSGFGIKGNSFAVGLDSPTWTKLSPLKTALLATSKADELSRNSTMNSDSQMPPKALEFLLAMDASPNANILDSVSADVNQESLNRPFAFWASGQVVYGSVGVETSSNKFHTDGVSLGVDFQLNPKAIMGAAVGYGNDITEVDALGSRLKGQQITVTAYGVYKPMRGWLVDGLLGFGELSFDNDRYSALSSTVFSAQRKGSSSYAALGLSLPFAVSNFNVKPYIRANYLETVLNAYKEMGDTNALAFERAKIMSSALVAGVMSSYDLVQTDGGKWTPHAKFEIRRNAAGSVNQVISFVDTPGATSTLDMVTAPRDVITLGLGIGYVRRNGLRFGLSWLESQGSDFYRSTGYKLEASISF
jgi:outer membrane autotransporter protein